MEVKSITEQKSLLATLSPGKRARLRRLLFDYGPGNGTLMLLPIDQGIEHGPRDFFPNPASKDPEYQFSLAAEAGYSAIACQIGLATRYYPDYAGQVPLILKINGKTDIPPSDDAFSSTNASVEDAVRLGADAVGYTMYLGSPRQDVDLHQLGGVREDCERYGMPLVIWAYPRGKYIEQKGGQNSFYAIDYAARMAMEMGADVVKLNFPKFDPEKDKELLAAASTVMHVDKIKAPLFIAQGAKDPRVNKDESDQMVAALRARGIEVEYMVKDNEGHGFHNEENRFEFYEAMERFLDKHLKVKV